MQNISNKRIGYIDALRGFAILMIVFMHVEHFCLGITYDESIWGSIIITFFLPVFFFISGFLAKVDKKPDLNSLTKQICKKGSYLLFPALIFYVLYYCVYRGESFFLLFDKGPRCYWFTIVLFYLFALFFIIQYLCSNLTKKFTELFLLLISFGFLIIYAGGTKYYHLDKCPILALTNVCRYFWYFAIGHVCRNHFSLFRKIILNEKIKVSCISLFILGFIVTWSKGFIHYPLIHVWILEYALWDLGTMMAILCFFHYQSYFESPRIVSSTLRFIGTRTFDIYLLHWFFIPNAQDLIQVGIHTFKPNTIIELSEVIIISLIIVSACLFVSAVLRTSSILSHYLFGVKPLKK